MSQSTSVDMFQYSLSDERFTLRPREVVLSVLVKQDNCPVLHLEFPVVLQTPDLHQQALRRLEVLREVKTGGADGPHVRRQGAVVACEPLHLLLAQTESEGGRENAARLPPVVPDTSHAVVDVGQEASLVPLQTGVPQLDTCIG